MIEGCNSEPVIDAFEQVCKSVGVGTEWDKLSRLDHATAVASISLQIVA